MLLCGKFQRFTCLCPFVLLSCRQTLGGDDDKVSMVRRWLMHAVPGTLSVNGAAVLSFLWVNRLRACWKQHPRMCRWHWSRVLPATVAIFVNCAVLFACPRHLHMSPVWSLQAHDHEKQEEQEKGHERPGGQSAAQEAELVWQTPDKGVGCVQTGRSPHFLQLQSPPDVEGDDNPQWQAAEVADSMRLPHLLVFARFCCFLVLLFHSYLPNITTLSISIPHCLSHRPVGDRRRRPQQAAQGLHSDQRCNQEQHHAVHVAEKEQEVQGNNIVKRSQPGLRDAKETEKSWKRQK